MNDRERLLDLLTTRATEGLTETESLELEQSLRSQAEFDIDDFDLAAAVADVAFESMAASGESMPEQLKERILEQAPTRSAVASFPQPTPVKNPGLLSSQLLGWYTAAAILLLALWAPWSRDVTTPPLPPVPTIAEQRTALIEEVPDVIKVRLKVSFTDLFIMSCNGVVLNLRKFSRSRSKITTVSLIE